MTQMLAFSMFDVLLEVKCSSHDSFLDDFVWIVDDEDRTLEKGKEVSPQHIIVVQREIRDN